MCLRFFHAKRYVRPTLGFTAILVTITAPSSRVEFGKFLRSAVHGVRPSTDPTLYARVPRSCVVTCLPMCMLSRFYCSFLSMPIAGFIIVCTIPSPVSNFLSSPLSFFSSSTCPPQGSYFSFIFSVSVRPLFVCPPLKYFDGTSVSGLLDDLALVQGSNRACIHLHGVFAAAERLPSISVFVRKSCFFSSRLPCPVYAIALPAHTGAVAVAPHIM